MESGGWGLAQKKTLSAKEVVTDIRSGLSDDEIMKKYGISAKGFQSLMAKLVTAGILKQAELEARSKLFEETVEVDGRPPGARPVMGPSSESQDISLSNDSDQKLRTLKEAFEAGILNKAEYESKKEALTHPPHSPHLGAASTQQESNSTSGIEHNKGPEQSYQYPSPSVRFCRCCGAQISQHAEFCVSCGCKPNDGDKHCQRCGATTSPKQEICVKCGGRLDKATGLESAVKPTDDPPKDWLVTLLLCWLLGFLGVHRFYTGHIGIGVVQLLTGGLCLIWTIVDFIMILAGKFVDANGRPLRRK